MTAGLLVIARMEIRAVGSRPHMLIAHGLISVEPGTAGDFHPPLFHCTFSLIPGANGCHYVYDCVDARPATLVAPVLQSRCNASERPLT